MQRPGPRRRTVLGAAAAAAGLTIPARSLWAAPRRGGTLVMAVWPDPVQLVSAFSTSDQMTIVSPKVCEGLVEYGYDFRPQPALATAWEVAPDGLSIRFTLRQGVTWHDGRDFTSADVAYTLLEILKRYHPRGRVAYANLDAVETPDAATAVLRLSKPSPMIMNALAGFESPMLPRHLYADRGDPLRNPANLAPVGTGPFRFEEWGRGERIAYVRNDRYWDPGKPYLDRIVMRIINDAASRSAALEAGEILLAGPNPVPYSEVARFRGNPKLVVETRGEELLTHGQGLQVNLRNPILAKPDVRRAILHAINREALARAVWYGAGRPATGPVPYQAGELRAPSLPAYPYDPKAAEALLDGAGHPKGADGMRFRLRLDWVPLGEANLRTAEFIKQSLRRVGIDADIRSADLPTYLRRVYGEYDFDLNAFLQTPTHDPSLGVQRFYWSKAASPGSPFVNASGYASPEADQLLEGAAVENDPARRRQLLWDFQRVAMTDLPILPLLDLDYVTILARSVQDVMLRPAGIRGSFADVWLDPAG